MSYGWFAKSTDVKAETEDEKFQRVYTGLSHDIFFVSLHPVLRVLSLLITIAPHFGRLDHTYALWVLAGITLAIIYCAYSRRIWPLVFIYLVVKWVVFAYDTVTLFLRVMYNPGLRLLILCQFAKIWYLEAGDLATHLTNVRMGVIVGQNVETHLLAASVALIRLCVSTQARKSAKKASVKQVHDCDTKNTHCDANKDCNSA